MYVTHDQAEATTLADKIGVLKEGKIVQIGTPEEIVVNPVDEYVADFVKGISRLKVVQAKTIMQNIEEYESKNGKIELYNIR